MTFITFNFDIYNISKYKKEITYTSISYTHKDQTRNYYYNFFSNLIFRIKIKMQGTQRFNYNKT